MRGTALHSCASAASDQEDGWRNGSPDSLFRERASAPSRPARRVRPPSAHTRGGAGVADRMPYNWERRRDAEHPAHDAPPRLGALSRGGSPRRRFSSGTATADPARSRVGPARPVLLLFRRTAGSHGRARAIGSPRTEARFAPCGLVSSYAARHRRDGRIGLWRARSARLRRADWRDSRRNVWYVERALIDNPHRPFHTPEALYRRWHRRYLEFKRRHPSARPVYYPGRLRWLNTRM